MSRLFNTIYNLSLLTVSPKLNQKSLFELMGFDFGVKAISGQNIPVPFEVLAQSEIYQERWQSNKTVKFSAFEFGWQWQNDDFLVLLMTPTDADIDSVSQLVYQQALNQAEALNYFELIRTWNYFPRINETEQGMERYQRFCVIRQDVLNQFPSFQVQNPAATAIGTHWEENNFVFLFAKEKGVGIENRRQLSAWEYPSQYAPKQPRFARAMWHSGVLICSGTASVVGHETQHVGDVLRQCEESLLNVETLLQQSENKVSLVDGFFRFYLRDPSDTGAVVKLLVQAGIKHYVILAADVCREDLLIECEAVFQK